MKPLLEKSKPLLKKYVEVSAVGAVAGGSLGGVCGAILSGPMFFEGMRHSDAKTFPGKLTNGIELAGATILSGALIGTLIGATPITYPVSKLYEYAKSDPEKLNKRKT